jgi:hypothetical protein
VLYRYRIYCNLCGSRGEGRSSPRRLEEPLEGLRILSLFPAWQIEEVLCIHKFGKDIYGGVFHHVTDDLNDEDLGRTLFSGRVDCKSIASPSALTVHVSSESRYLPKDYLQISTESIDSLCCDLASFSCPSYYSRLRP